MGDIKAFAYGVLGWSEKRLMNASIDEFVYACIGWHHNDLYQMQTTNNLNSRLGYAIAHIMTAKREINLEPIFRLFEQKENKEQLIDELEQIATKIPSKINGKKRR